MRIHLLPAVWIVCLATSTAADVIYVDDSAKGGVNDGTSWADAYLDLQDALFVANPGDEIRVAQGVYKPGGHEDTTFHLRNGVVLQGGYAGLDAADPNELNPRAFRAWLSGSISNGNVWHVVTADGVDESTELRGVWIGGGRAYETDGEHSWGAGMRCLNGASPLIIDCTFNGNEAYWGAGGLATGSAAVRIVNCTFVNNSVGYMGLGNGGGLAGSQPVLEGCRFIENGAGATGGGAYVTNGVFRHCVFQSNGAEDAGGLSRGIAIDCVFRDNSAVFHGGGADYAVLINCQLIGNFAGKSGGGAYVRQAINCLFVDNTTYMQGGGASSAGNAAFLHCTFVGNQAPHTGYGAGIHGGASSTIKNCIFWNNADSEGSSQEAQIWGLPSTIENCCVQGWTGSLGGVGNFDDDPLMIDADGPDNVYGTSDDNLRLSANSPCRDAGNNTALPADHFDLDDDGDKTEPTPLDLDLLPRVNGGVVDIGCFEFQATCAGDVSPVGIGNGLVDVNDLLLVVGNWGATGESPADVNGDRVVDVNDLLAVVAAWGECA